MGFMFYPTGGVEAGIDGYHRIAGRGNREVGNLLLQVQGKATERERLQGDTAEAFEFPCCEDDIAYWTQGTAPVLLIVCSLNESKAYWKSLKEWFADPERMKSRKGRVRQSQGRIHASLEGCSVFGRAAVGPGASRTERRKHEQLLLNLLE